MHRRHSETLTLEQENLLVRAFEAEAALPALKTLQVDHALSLGRLIALSRTLRGGTAPLLQHLDIHGRLWGTRDEVWDVIADMVEARVSLSGCARFESFDVCDWLNIAPVEKQTRLLRALLPSVKELPSFQWRHAFEACFVEVKAPFLTVLHVPIDEEDETIFSWKALEAAPALHTIRTDDMGETSDLLGAKVFKSVTTALRHGAL